MNDAFRAFAGVIILVFLGYVGYQLVEGWSVAASTEEQLNNTVRSAERVNDPVIRIQRYNAAYAAVTNVLEARTPFYRLIFGNPLPEMALVLDHNLEQTVNECAALPPSQCVYRLAAVEGMATGDRQLRDMHRKLMVSFSLAHGLAGDAMALAGTIEVPLLKAAAFEDIAGYFHRAGQDEAASAQLEKIEAALNEAPAELARAAETAQYADLLLTMKQPIHATRALKPAIAMTVTRSESTAFSDRVYALLQITALMAAADDLEGVRSAVATLRDVWDSRNKEETLGPLPLTQAEGLLAGEIAKVEGADAADGYIQTLDDDLGRAFARIVAARTLGGLQQVQAADGFLQAGIAGSQKLGITLPLELLVEIAGAQSILGYFPAAQITLQNIDDPALLTDARWLVARNLLLAGRDGEARPLFNTLIGTDYAYRLAELGAVQPSLRVLTVAGVQEAANRLLRLFRRLDDSRFTGFERRLEEREVFTDMSSIREAITRMQKANGGALTAKDTAGLLAMVEQLRLDMSPMPVKRMLARACQGLQENCRVDPAYLRGYAFRHYVLPVLAAQLATQAAAHAGTEPAAMPEPALPTPADTGTTEPVEPVLEAPALIVPSPGVVPTDQ